MNIKYILMKKIYHNIKNTINININYQSLKITQSLRPKFGDYQINGILSIASILKKKPLNLAKKIASLLDYNNIIKKIEVIPPGFINIFLNPEWLKKEIIHCINSSRFNILPTSKPKNIIIDYSSPNLAKEMHIGHIRSTIIGDSLVRIIKFLGHNVIKVNHVGDWGMQFGMLIAYLKKIKQENKKKIFFSNINLNKLYLTAKILFDKDPIFFNIAHDYTLKLQKGDKYCKKIWFKLVNYNIKKNQKVYKKLNVLLTKKDIVGESFYNDMIPEIIKDLIKQKLAIKSNGAFMVYVKKFQNKQGKPMGVIIQKKNGAYLYTTIELACLKYRYKTLKADRIIYYTDSRQRQHFQQVWEIAKNAGYISNSIKLNHYTLGMILDKHGKPLKSREGNAIQLSHFLNKAIKKTKNIIKNKNPNLNYQSLNRLSKIIGIGAIKYADLSKNRNTNYIFNWDKILNFEGNTSLYIQYAYIRIISILKKVKINNKIKNIELNSNIEIKIITHILQYEETIVSIYKNGTPHILCLYLYKLSMLFSSFYEQKSILNTNNKTLKNSRIQLIKLISKIIKHGLNLLGIQTTRFI